MLDPLFKKCQLVFPGSLTSRGAKDIEDGLTFAVLSNNSANNVQTVELLLMKHCHLNLSILSADAFAIDIIRLDQWMKADQDRYCQHIHLISHS